MFLHSSNKVYAYKTHHLTSVGFGFNNTSTCNYSMPKKKFLKCTVKTKNPNMLSIVEQLYIKSMISHAFHHSCNCSVLFHHFQNSKTARHQIKMLGEPKLTSPWDKLTQIQSSKKKQLPPFFCSVSCKIRESE